MKRSMAAARLVSRNFELLSWIFFILTVWSLVWTGQGVYNYAFYGSCNGLNVGGFCVFDPTGSNNAISTVSATTTCAASHPPGSAVTLGGVDMSVFPAMNTGAKDSLVFIGCFGCKYTREVYPAIRKLVDSRDVAFTFAHFPVKPSFEYLSALTDCAYRIDPERSWKLNDALFGMSIEALDSPDEAFKTAEVVGYDAGVLRACTTATSTQALVKRQADELAKTGLYGTPTIFINEKPIVGPKPYFVYKNLLWKWGR
jgi:protein-disulfide isomerase